MKNKTFLVLAITSITIFSSGCSFFSDNDTPDSSSKELTEAEIQLQGMEALQKGDYEEAIEKFSAAIEKDGGYTIAYFNRGVAYASQKLYARAIIDYNRVIELEPEAPDAYYNRGVAQQIIGHDNEALADYNKAIELAPENKVAYLNRGILYRRLGKNEEAIADFTKSIELVPGDGRAYFQRGLTYGTVGDETKQIEDLRKSAELGNAAAQTWMDENGYEYEKTTQPEPTESETSEEVVDLTVEPQADTNGQN